ncbi:MAG: ABC transporter permease, partial [Nitrososphaerales archaeon]
NMLAYIVKRVTLVIPVFLGVSIIVFVIMVNTPGDPILIRIGVDPNVSPEKIEAARRELGLDQPIYVQYFKFLTRLLQGDLGNNIRTGRPVAQDILEAFPRTLILAVTSIILAIAIGIPAGILSAKKQYSIFDNVASVGSLLAASMPNFWLALVLILIFSYWLKLTPISGYGTPMHLILPTIALGTALAGTVTRFTRSNMLEVIRQDFIRTAKAKGLKESIITFRHALKNALIPIVTVIGLQFGSLLAGAFFVEVVFAYPGIGRLAVQAILQKNYTVVQGAILVVSISFVLINLLVDIIYAYIDPRVQYE